MNRYACQGDKLLSQLQAKNSYSKLALRKRKTLLSKIWCRFPKLFTEQVSINIHEIGNVETNLSTYKNHSYTSTMHDFKLFLSTL